MKKLLTALLVVVILTTCIACGKTETTGSNSDKDTLTFALGTDIDALDPFQTGSMTSNVVSYEIYRGLVYLDENSKPQPSMAKSWDISPDGMEYTFYLRDDVLFHNGEKFTADDVVFTAEMAMNSPITRGDFGTFVEKAEAIDDYTVKFTLKEPFTPFLLHLEYYTPIHSRKAWEDAGSAEKYLEHPIGTGPYEFVSNEPGVKVVLKKFDDYYGGGPNIQPEFENVIFRIYNDPSAMSVAVETGEVDIVGSFYGKVPPSNIPLLEDNDDVEVIHQDSLLTTYLIMNMNEPLFADNIDLRKAINYAIDKQFVIDTAADGRGDIATSLPGPLVFGYSDKVKGYSYDIEKAKQHLAAAGYPNGEGLPTLVLSAQEQHKAVAESVQSSMQEAGIDVEIDIMERNAFLEDATMGNYQIGIMSISLNADAAIYSNCLASAHAEGGLNSSQLKDPHVDELFVKGAGELDEKKRLDIYEELFMYIDEQAYLAPIYYEKITYVYNKDLNLGTVYPKYLSASEITMKK